MWKITLSLLAAAALAAWIAWSQGKRQGDSEGYLRAVREIQSAAVEIQQQVVSAPRASRDDQEFLNSIKVGKW